MYGLHLTVRRPPSHSQIPAKTRLYSTEQSSVCASLEQLVKDNWQQDSRRTFQFEKLRRNGLETLGELQKTRIAYEETLQKDHEFYERKIQGIHKLYNKILDENREYNRKILRHGEERDLAVTKSLTKLSSKLDHLADLAWKSTIEYHILDSLFDKGMAARYEKIADAHAQTFEWIFQDYTRPTDSRYGDTFVEWLSHGTGIFWVTGKAGSGKSTLMKFLSHHHLTSETLTHWSGNKKLIIASFYFWYAGTEFQKSQKGLLQSLLYEIFRQCPEMMPIVLPQHWDPTFSPSSSSHITWTRSELIAAFNCLARQPKLTSVFCFFIDGLDEFDGDHEEIVALIQGFANSENIKWCLSSRPWNVFKAAFGDGAYPSFQLEHLTKEDIILYVRDELEENEAFRNLKRQEGIACATLVDEIVEKAKGVFLWVFLVVRSLTSGLQNADRIIDLQRRLRRVPTDLEKYFQHMLNSIDDNYRQQTAQTFLIALQASEPLSLMTYAMVDELEIDPSYALDLGIQQMSSADITSKHRDMKLRINARCKDLLEVTPVRPKPRVSLDKETLGDDLSKSVPSFYGYQVDFLHRTVRDFLHLKEISKWVLGNVSCGFNVDQSLCAAFLAQVKTISVQNHNIQRDGQFSCLVDDMLHYARRMEFRTNTSPTQLLDSFHEAVENKMDDRQADLSLYRDERQLLSSAIYPYQHYTAYETPQHNYNMLRVLISKGVSPTCVEVEPEVRERICGDVYRSWLEMAQSLELLETSTTYALGPRKLQWVMYVVKALRSWLRDDSPFESILSETIETFLRRGVNPNWVYGKHSLWTYFTACLYWEGSFPACHSAKSQECALRVVKAFYRRGASRNQIIMLEAISDDLMDTEDKIIIPGIRSRQYRKNCGRRVLNAHAAIKSVISAEGMQELEFAERKSTLMPTVGKHGTDTL